VERSDQGEVAVYSDGSPFLDGMYVAAEAALALVYSRYFAVNEVDGVIVDQPPPRLAD
jgi:hypothetical protein